MEDRLPKRVLVVSSDGRVAGALAALLGDVPGLLAEARAGGPHDVDEVVRAWRPHLAVVDLNALDAAHDLRVLGRLTRHIPVVAICDCEDLRGRALACGVVQCCDKTGEIDSLTAAVAAAAQGPAYRPQVSEY